MRNLILLQGQRVERRCGRTNIRQPLLFAATMPSAKRRIDAARARGRRPHPSLAADEGLAEDVGFRLQFVQAVLHHVTDADDALQSTLRYDR